ncbi:uncharacterized protein C5L36_0B11580 [Pichia kudriavzevii]|uniref:Plasma membrane proteolipid 3 n=1 Tax=Pichia kudriavzevii TaxID=4909 RepID=A0A2U9R455_PICKU|nr:uncharacterized protein C5L36_0B11580 [Pichia kudriavzevii]AWU75926.1 hypothetical protein C5L36_0B11580 [Pichia kudriavzevii]
MDSSKIFAYILAILLPPLAVLMVSGVGMDLGINILFCILAWFPGSHQHRLQLPFLALTLPRSRRRATKHPPAVPVEQVGPLLQEQPATCPATRDVFRKK